MYKITQYPADSGRAGGLRGGHGSGVSVKLNSFPPVLITFYEKLFIFQKIRDSFVFQHAAAAD